MLSAFANAVFIIPLKEKIPTCCIKRLSADRARNIGLGVGAALESWVHSAAMEVEWSEDEHLTFQKQKADNKLEFQVFDAL